jgi:hypothetical protein
MPHDEYDYLFEKCVHCGVDTVWKIDGVPVCRACAKEFETALTNNDQSGESYTKK